MSKAHIKSFQAVEAFRVALVKYADAAMLAMEDAESGARRTLVWLQTEQSSYWKAAARAAQEGLSRAQDAYRQKAYFKDATGARQSAVDELQAVRRWEARIAEVEQRQRATARHVVELKQEIQDYRGSTARLRNLIEGRIPVASADLREAVAVLERYAALAPEARGGGATEADAAMSRPEPTAQQSADLPDDATLRARTPTTRSRARAAASSIVPILPDVPAPARHATTPRQTERPPGRYDLVTLQLPEDVPQVYLERVEPTGPADTGWHVGPAGDTHAGGTPVVTLTFGRIAQMHPHLAELMRLGVGTLVVARGSAVARVIDGLGSVLWEETE